MAARQAGRIAGGGKEVSGQDQPRRGGKRDFVFPVDRLLQYPLYVSLSRTMHRNGFNLRVRIWRLEIEVVFGCPPWLQYVPPVRCKPRRIARGFKFYLTLRPYELRLTLQWLPAERRHPFRHIYRCPECHFEASRSTFAQETYVESMTK